MTLFPRLGTHWPFRYSLLVKILSVLLLPPKYQGLDESLISSFVLSDNSSGGGGGGGGLLQKFYHRGVRAKH